MGDCAKVASFGFISDCPSLSFTFEGYVGEISPFGVAGFSPSTLSVSFNHPSASVLSGEKSSVKFGEISCN